jgi:hypothetical protein
MSVRINALDTCDLQQLVFTVAAGGLFLFMPGIFGGRPPLPFPITALYPT